MKWRPGNTAPKNIVRTNGGDQYGPYFLADTDYGVVRLRWWQAIKNEDGRWQNFLGDCGNVFRVKHWTPLPRPPKEPRS